MIEIDNLAFAYARAEQPALSGVNLSIADGSLFGLLGPNGAGKTTLLAIMSGLLPCPVEAVRIAGIDVAVGRHDALAAIALVPQEYAFYPALSVRENLLFFARMQQIAVRDIPARLAEVELVAGLTDRFADRADRLSGGLKRRLNIAIGLLNRPQLLLLDEPTVGIDPHSRHFILEAIRDINRAGTTVVYTSHYMEEVEALCDDIAIIDAGKVLVQGSLGSLLQADEQSRLIVDLYQPLTDHQREAICQSVLCDEQGRSLSIKIDPEIGLLPVMQVLEQQRVAISRIQYGARNLEELFLNFTQRSLRD